MGLPACVHAVVAVVASVHARIDVAGPAVPAHSSRHGREPLTGSTLTLIPYYCVHVIVDAL